eukprot:TRINITY_DN778200_c0_g1_i1.p1 TRINITY_DN778200_c0_g1~~TRINITY_DN778200_c0_g1_i1.p1  ORF type:complete len:280 (-),score=72.90 TRINITY_DN778200_c0_g1_i1:144-983(-)
METHTVSIVPPGKKKILVEQISTDSREQTRLPQIISNAKALEERKRFLNSQTKTKNQRFNEDCDAVSQRTKNAKLKLDHEVVERANADNKLRARVEGFLSKVSQLFLTKMDDRFLHLERDVLNSHLQRLTNLDRAIDHFVNIEIPEMVEQQSGEIVRTMLNSRESFDIENAKTRIREKKIVNEFETFKRDTSVRFNHEKEDFENMFKRLEDDINAKNAAMEHADSIFRGHLKGELDDLRTRVDNEVATRNNQHNEILQTLQQTMEMFQAEVLLHFGSEH